jgi:hypothetical protein
MDLFKVFTSKCEVVRISDRYVYPIFKNGYTTLCAAAEEILIDEQIKNLKTIEVLLRDPEQRFVSGINEYSRQEEIDVNTVWQLVNRGELVNKHFVPQYVWIMHLYKFFKGDVKLMQWNEIGNLTDIHLKGNDSKTVVPAIERFVAPDKYLLSMIGQKVQLESIVRRYKNVLS